MSRPRHPGVPDAPFRFGLRLPLPLLLAVGVALAACDGTTEPEVDLPFNELAIHSALLERLVVFNHSIEANANLGLAFDSRVRDFEPIPAELLGRTLVYNFDDLEWQVDEGADPRPANSLRVRWYPLTGSALLTPEPRGYIDLTRQTDSAPNMERVHVGVVRTAVSPGNLTDYFIRYGTTTAGTAETRTFEADGWVSDATRAVAFRLREVTTLAANGTVTASQDLEISDAGITYTSVLAGTRTATSETLSLVMTIVREGATTRVELDVQEPTGQVSSGTGEVRHDGVKVADIAVAGDQMTFTRPSGGSFRTAQSRRLTDLVGAMLNPVLVAEVYFR
jgi:hypothetical protein